MAEKVLKPAGGKWNEATTWEPEGVPAIGDDVVFKSTSGNIEIGTATEMRSWVIQLGYTGNVKITENITFKIGTSTVPASNIAVDWPTSGWTYETGSKSPTFSFATTEKTTPQTINFGGKATNAGVTLTTNGNWKLLSTLSLSSAKTLALNNGTLDTNSQSVNAGQFGSTGANTRKLICGTSTFSLGLQNNFWQVEGSNYTIEAGSATIITTRTTTHTMTFVGGGATYGKLVAVAGTATTGPVVVGPSANNVIKIIEAGAGRIVKLGAGKTQTVENLVLSGTVGNLTVVESSESGVAATIKKVGGQISNDYLKIKDIHFLGESEAKFFAGTHSENVSGNENITFGAPQGKPVASTEGAPAIISAVLQGTVNPNGLEVEYWFEYGTSISYGTKTTVGTFPAGSTNKSVTAEISNLTAGQIYHYRLVAKNSEGTTNGTDRTLTASGGGVLSLIV